MRGLAVDMFVAQLIGRNRRRAHLSPQPRRNTQHQSSQRPRVSAGNIGPRAPGSDGRPVLPDCDTGRAHPPSRLRIAAAPGLHPAA